MWRKLLPMSCVPTPALWLHTSTTLQAVSNDGSLASGAICPGLEVRLRTRLATVSGLITACHALSGTESLTLREVKNWMPKINFKPSNKETRDYFEEVGTCALAQ